MTDLNNIILTAGKFFLLVLFAPLVSGVIRKIKNNIRMRKGPGILQPYFDAKKLFLKSEVISGQASWIFYAAPVVVFVSSLCALSLILMIHPGLPMISSFAILIAVFFVLSLGRFFLALAGLDTASSFGGMGSSREMFISSFAEPTAIVAAFVLCLAGVGSYKASILLAGFAMLMVLIAETSRIPVDNQETHLELTMVHEAMVLEYSGKSLALIELAAHIKQMIFIVILSWYFFSVFAGGSSGWLSFSAEAAVISFVVALIEMSVAKMRLFRVVDFLSFSFFIALFACVMAGLGF